MKGASSGFARLTLLAVALCWTARAGALSSYYSNGIGSNQACTNCHSSTVTTCNGCHAHGTHADSSKSAIDVVATTNKTTYQPGETVTVTVNGGYRNGWVRVNLYDSGMTQLARSSCPGGTGGCTTAVLPATLTANAPTTPGTYTWRASWYGNAYDVGVTSPACGNPAVPPCFRVDPNNAATGAVHGEEIVAVTQFTVASPAAPTIAVSPASLAFGNVAVGGSGTRTFAISNAGGATLTGTVARGAGTSGEFAASPATFSIAPGGAAVTVTVTYTPSGAGSDTGAFAVASNDPANAEVSVAVSGTGVTTPVPIPIASVSPASVDFGAVTVGSSASRPVTIQNTGTGTLNVSGISLGSATSPEFAWSPAAPFTVPAGGSATLTLTYHPTDGTADAGAIVIASDDPASPAISVTVSGSGALQGGSSGGGGGGGGGGCGSGGPGGWLALAAVSLLAARRLGRRPSLAR